VCSLFAIFWLGILRGTWRTFWHFIFLRWRLFTVAQEYIVPFDVDKDPALCVDVFKGREQILENMPKTELYFYFLSFKILI
jgi:hypothetical protein